jgi:membrane protease YdiL (CAAX protease family)
MAKKAKADEVQVVETALTSAQKQKYGLYLLLSAALAFLGAQFLGPTLLGFMALAFGVKSDNLVSFFDQDAARFGLILAIELLTIWFVSLMLKRRQWKWADIGLGRPPQLRDLLRGLKIYGIYFIIFIIVYELEQLSGLINTEQAQQLGFENSHGPQLIFVFLSLVILPPIAEEIIFRGYIFLGFRKHIRFITSVIITSLVFSVAHLEFGSGNPLNWAAAIDTFTLSCILAYSVERSRSLWPAMIAHGLKNFVAFTALYLLK